MSAAATACGMMAAVRAQAASEARGQGPPTRSLGAGWLPVKRLPRCASSDVAE